MFEPLIRRFVKATIIPNVKVVPNDIFKFKFGDERVKLCSTETTLFEIR